MYSVYLIKKGCRVKKFSAFLTALSIFSTHCVMIENALDSHALQSSPQEPIFIDYVFTDLAGSIKSVTQWKEYAKKSLDSGLYIDGSSIKGFSSIAHSDLLLVPDVRTQIALPWCAPERPAAQVICNVHRDKNTPFELCPRSILQHQLQRAYDRGYAFLVGPELEFFLLKDETPCETAAYCDTEASLTLKSFEHNLLTLLAHQEIDVEKIHHEVAAGQYEISINYNDALSISDQIIRAKHTIKTVAQHYGLRASFIPKLRANCNGSGMHLHMSLLDVNTNENAFINPNGDTTISPIGRSFMAGVLHYLPDITAILNSGINSYKRLVPGYEAPTTIGWGYANRSVCMRVPKVESHEKEGIRAELRSPDALANPYLACAAILAAGLRGIEDNLTLQTEISESVYTMNKEKRALLHIQSLPASLDEALTLFEESDFVRETFGDVFVETYSALKRKELYDFQTSVTDWELKKYGC